MNSPENPQWKKRRFSYLFIKYLRHCWFRWLCTLCYKRINELKCKTKKPWKNKQNREKKLWKQTTIALLILISIVEFKICIWKYKTQFSCNNIQCNTVYYENEQISDVFRNQSKWLGFVRTKKIKTTAPNA